MKNGKQQFLLEWEGEKEGDTEERLERQLAADSVIRVVVSCQMSM